MQLPVVIVTPVIVGFVHVPAADVTALRWTMAAAMRERYVERTFVR
jgi:hypothetical protein